MNKYTYMIVTIEWMEEWFRRFDQEYFGGKLPVPELGLTHAKTRLGQLAYKRASRWGRTKLTFMESGLLLSTA